MKGNAVLAEAGIDAVGLFDASYTSRVFAALESGTWHEARTLPRHPIFPEAGLAEAIELLRRDGHLIVERGNWPVIAFRLLTPAGSDAS